MKGFFYVVNLLILALLLALSAQGDDLKLGIERTEKYFPHLEDKKVGIVANQTSRIDEVHLLDTLLSAGFNVQRVFAPEHGFRGDYAAGAQVADDKDKETGTPVVSLYGDNRKPSPSMLEDLDVVIFDIQDVGVRFYTYISTMHYVMEVAAETGTQVMILDRPNPNGHFVDGPVLEKEFQSFVGMHPIPVVHGMTVGELAKMINGEGWLEDGRKADLKVIPNKNYARHQSYAPPVEPSPNLPTIESIYLYPSLCFFEGTSVSVGRGTDYPFQVIGKPGFEKGDYTFTPQEVPGKAENPPYENQECRGFKLIEFAENYIRPSKELYLKWLIAFYEESNDQEEFFNDFFDLLAGTDQLRKQIKNGLSEEEIRETWKEDLKEFRKKRQPYLIYP